MEKLFSYLRRNIKLAYKSVVFHFRQYICFYVALFIIQFLFGIIVMSTVNTNHMRKTEIQEKYDYHVCLSGLNGGQKDYIEKKQYGGDGKDRAMVDHLKTEERYENGKLCYDLYLVYENNDGDSPEEIHSWFENAALKNIRSKKFNNPNFDVNFSPLYNLNNTLSSNIWTCILFLTLLLLVGVAILVLLYNIRINHFKFTYGIYMSFGADFKKLFETSFWEMFMIQLLTLIPATIAATVADLLFFVCSGYSYFFSPYMMLIALPFTGLAAFLAVYIPIKRASVKPPLQLLLAEDNSNLVTSPRLSFNMENRKFPGSYSLFSAIRFRKYNIQLVCSAVVFSALFICSMFSAQIYSYTMNEVLPEYEISFNQHTETKKELQKTGEKDVTEEYLNADVDDLEKYNDETKYRIDGSLYELSTFKVYEFIYEEVDVPYLVGDTYTAEKGEELLSMQGITGIYKEHSIDATESGTFLQLYPESVKQDGDMVMHNSYMYTQNAEYYATDKDIVDYLVANYQYSGDPYKLLDTDNRDVLYVIVTNSRNNSDTLALKPGDSVMIETLSKINQTPSEPLTGRPLLEFLLKNSEMDLDRSYRLEVCAVIENITTGSDYPLFISNSSFELITGSKPEFKKVSVYVDQSLNREALDRLTARIRFWSEKYTDTYVTPLHALENKEARLAECRLPLLICISLSLLLLAPLFWFFSQIMFYQKREREISLLRAMGAIESEIRHMFVLDGIFYSVFGAIATALFGGVGIYAVYRVSMRLMAFSNDSFAPRFALDIPWLAFALGIAITVLSAFMSSMIPYHTGKKRARKRLDEISADDD